MATKNRRGNNIRIDTTPQGATPGCRGSRRLRLAFLLLITPFAAQSTAQPGPAKQGGLYASVGIGILNLEKGLGMGIPASVVAIVPSRRLVATAGILDLGLLQGNDRDPRYVRTRSNFSGSPVCVDSRSEFVVVSRFRCSGGTDALHSFSFDVSYIPIKELWMGGRPGLVFVGAGMRLLNPQTPYGTVGMYFQSQKRTRAGFKIAFGEQYLYAGILWAYDSKWF